jgi:polysaccharide pyruvyl transferase CsaB
MKLCVVGYYGYGNFGDELILRGLEDELRDIEGCKASFLVHDPGQYAQRLSSCVDYVERSSPAAVCRALLSSDGIMLGGGGLIQDATSCRSALYYLGMPLLGRLAHKKTIAYAQGVGPLRHRPLRMLTSMAFRHMVLVDVRDDASRTLLTACGVDRARIHVSSDVALAYLCRVAQSAVLLDSAVDSPIVVALNERFGWSATAMAGALDEASRAMERPLALVVLFPAADLEYTKQVHHLLQQPSQIEAAPGPEELVQLCRRAVCCVAGRYHMAVTALAAGTPTVALSYDPKMDSLAQDFGCVAVQPGSDPHDLATLVVKHAPSTVDPAAVRAAAGDRRAERIAMLRRAFA